jgi:hypothetical protein
MGVQKVSKIFVYIFSAKTFFCNSILYCNEQGLIQKKENTKFFSCGCNDQ